jgi:diguanylate cyclase (GGDEF)-like protein
MFAGSTVLVLGLVQFAIGIAVGVSMAGWFHELVGQIREILDDVADRRMAKRTVQADVAEAPVPEIQADTIARRPDFTTAADPELESTAPPMAPQGAVDKETGLPDATAFAYYLSREITVARRRGSPLCVILCEADQFIQVRDHQGEIVGAEVMQSIANLMVAALPENVLVARYDDALLAVILPGYDLESGPSLAEGLRREVGASAIGDDVNGTIEATLSVALAGLGPDDDPDSILMRADIALAAARSAGGGCAYLHDGKVCVPISPTPTEVSG